MKADTVHGRSDPALPGDVAALSVRALSVGVRTPQGLVQAAADVSFDLAPGEVLALLGESGSGKSVTARAVMGLLRSNGKVEVGAEALRLGDQDLLALDDAAYTKLRGERISLVFQDALSALNPVLSIGDQVGELFRVHRGASRKAARSEAVGLLRSVGIPAAERRVDDFPHQFSGGMRQRILIAMAIALRPDVLIADEPTTALDVTVQAQILELLDDLRHELGTAVLLITHDLGVVAQVADRVAVMYAGRIVETGPVEAFFARPAHPYGEALLASVPRLAGGDAEIQPIPGSPPSLLAIPPGCPYHPRCGYRAERCTVERPALRPVVPARAAACHFSEEVLGVRSE